MLAGIVTVSLLAGLGLLPTTILADDIYCDAHVPCEIGCCGKYNVCGMGPTYCGEDTCINNCDAKAECNPGGWPDEYVNATTCPLNVCCSPYGFCGTTDEFCTSSSSSSFTRPSCNVDSQSLTRVIGYYASAGASRSCGGMQPASFPQGVYSHVYFAFGSINPDTFEVIPAGQSDEELYPQLQALQSRDLGQQLWLSIGGWSFSDSGSATATTFSDLAAADLDRQAVFFSSLTSFLLTWGFQGVDIDWEYPAAGDRNGRVEDFTNFPTFLSRLRKSLDEYNMGLSITLPTSYWYLQHFDLVSIEPSVDWFNYMSYDLHGTWDIGNEWTGAYLSAHTNLTEIKSAIDLLWRNNITASKVNLGLAFYGRSFTLAGGCTTPGCEYLSAGDAGTCSDSAGILFNSEIADIMSENNVAATLYPDAAVKTVTWSDQWVSFDDEETFKLKADFAKSQCLGGVLVWSVDYDDSNHTYSRGLAAALGNAINVDSSTGLTTASFDELAMTSGGSRKEDGTTTTTTGGQDKYCRFLNCGDVCPSGFTTVVRADQTSQLILDSTHCLPGSHETQTLCCPTASEVPSCRWRGFHNNGHCTAGCEDGEVEVGTVSKGCSRGYQSACCTATDSTAPWGQCRWTTSCSSDQRCPSDEYSTFVVSSRQGWGGQPSCDGGKWYNLCCSSSSSSPSPPNAFTNCEWSGHEETFINSQYCTDTCPSGTIRVAEQEINTMWGGKLTAYTSDCSVGNEAYCCAGTQETSNDLGPRSPLSTTGYKDRTAADFDAYLQKFLVDPVCPAAWDSQYSAVYTWMTRRDATLLQLRQTQDQTITLSYLLPLMSMWITSQRPRNDLTEIYVSRLQENGLDDLAANVSVLTDALYGDDYYWTPDPIYSPMTLIADTLCDIADSKNGLEELALATATMCDDVDDDESDSAKLFRRALTESCMNDRSANGVQPTITAALRGAINGDLSIHYLRWINADGNQIILEIAFWIGPSPGVAPSAALLARYADSSHTAARDRWIIMHLHIDLGYLTFRRDAEALNPGVATVTIYHGQQIYRPGAVTRGRTPDYRADFRRTSNYGRGQFNTGALRNYNARTQALSCYEPDDNGDNSINEPNRRFYVGLDRREAINEASTMPTRPTGYAELLNQFNLWLYAQDVFSIANIQMIFPDIRRYYPETFPVTPHKQDYREAFAPVDGAFDRNFMPDGSDAPDISRADP